MCASCGGGEGGCQPAMVPKAPSPLASAGEIGKTVSGRRKGPRGAGRVETWRGDFLGREMWKERESFRGGRAQADSINVDPFLCKY